MKVAVWFRYKSYTMPTSINCSSGVYNTVCLWNLAESQSQSYLGGELAKVLEYTNVREATDPRDKPYGVLGLTRFGRKGEEIPSLILPDYTRPLNRVVQDLTRFIIRDSKNVDHFRWIDNNGDWPSLEKCSWQIPLDIKPNAGRASQFARVYKSCVLKPILSEEDTLLYTQHSDILCLKGSHIDCVSDMSKVMSVGSDEISWELDLVFAELSAWISNRVNCSGTISSTYSRRCLARTITAGLRSSQTIATDEDINTYENILSRYFDSNGLPKEFSSEPSSAVQKADEGRFCQTMQMWSRNRRCFWTEKGFLGL
jgi:hypothetical protein